MRAGSFSSDDEAPCPPHSFSGLHDKPFRELPPREPPARRPAGDDAEVQDILSKLLFISTIRPGERVDVASLTVVQNSFLARLHRGLSPHGESRATTLEFVRGVLGAAFDLLSRPPLPGGLSACLVPSLTNARKGVMALSETYKDDRMYVSRLHTLVGVLDARVSSSPAAPGKKAWPGSA